MAGRFELRSTRTGHLECVHSKFDEAKQYAENLRSEFGDTFCIIDLDLLVLPGDDRIVWRQSDVSPEARAYIFKHATFTRGITV